MNCGREPEGPGEVEGAGDEVVGAVLAGVGRSGRRSGFGFLGEPVSARALGAGKGWPGLLRGPLVTVGRGLVVVVGVPLDTPLRVGVSHVQESS